MSGVSTLSGQQDHSECWEQARCRDPCVSQRVVSPAALPPVLSPARVPWRRTGGGGGGAGWGLGVVPSLSKLRGRSSPSPCLGVCTPLGRGLLEGQASEKGCPGLAEDPRWPALGWPRSHGHQSQLVALQTGSEEGTLQSPPDGRSCGLSEGVLRQGPGGRYGTRPWTPGPPGGSQEGQLFPRGCSPLSEACREGVGSGAW